MLNKTGQWKQFKYPGSWRTIQSIIEDSHIPVPIPRSVLDDYQIVYVKETNRTRSLWSEKLREHKTFPRESVGAKWLMGVHSEKGENPMRGN